MLNRCISKLFFDPAILNAGVNDGEKEELLNELKRSEEIILLQLNTDKKDVWALADLALIRVLLAEEDPTTAYSRVVDQRPLYDTYESILSVLEPFSALNTPAKESLESAVRFLQKNVPK